MSRIENQIIPLMPYDPQKITPQEKPNTIEGLQLFAKWLIKNHCNIKKYSWGPSLHGFGKGLPNDVSCIMPHLLSQWPIEKSMLHQLHRLRATMKATLIHLCRHHLHHSFIATAVWRTDQRKVASFYVVCLCRMIRHLKEVKRGISFHHLSEIDFLRASWVVIHFLPSLANYTRMGVTSCHHHCAGSKNCWSNLPKKMLNIQ